MVFFYNSVNTELLKYYLENDFLFKKETQDFILLNHGKKSSSCENINFLADIKSIHISDVDNNNKNDLFIYPISTGGNNELSFGIEDGYHMGKTIFDFISKKCIELLNNKNFVLLLYFGLEHEIKIEYFSKIYISLQNNNINPNKVWIVSNNFKAHENNLQFLEKFKLNLSKKLNFLIYYEQMETKANEMIGNSHLFMDENDLLLNRKNKCLFLNRRMHWHRKAFLSLISNDNLFENNLISFNLDFESKENDDFEDCINDDRYSNVDIFFTKKQFETSVFNISEKYSILNGYKKLNKIGKIVLDVDDLYSIDGRELEVDDINLYKNSYFSLVSESVFFERWNNFTTEKILKPIQQLHPFLVLGKPHTLKYIKSYGFKTFSDYWDESYDEEIIDSKRLFKVYNIFKELCNKTDEEWIEIYKSLKNILIYNRNLLKKYSYKNQQNVFNNLNKYISNEHIQKNPKLLQAP